MQDLQLRRDEQPHPSDLYLLVCHRYIEMHPVRADIVKASEEYPFSIYETKTGLRELKWLDHDPVYLSLGKTEDEDGRNTKDGLMKVSPKVNGILLEKQFREIGLMVMNDSRKRWKTA